MEGFLAIIAALLLFGFIWCHCATTPQERAAIRRLDFPLQVSHAAGPTQCPRCGSARLICQDGEFCTRKALAGLLLTGNPLGANAGLLGKRCVPCTCLDCGFRFTACTKPATRAL